MFRFFFKFNTRVKLISASLIHTQGKDDVIATLAVLLSLLDGEISAGKFAITVFNVSSVGSYLEDVFCYERKVQPGHVPWHFCQLRKRHYGDVMMGAIASQITSLTIVHSTVYSDADQRKHESSASLAFVWGIHRGPVNSPHKWPVTRKMFPFNDVIMICV